MKLIAVNTIHGGKVTRAADPRNAKDRGKAVHLIAKPGAEFDTVDFGISDDEALELIKAGVAKRKMRAVTEADEGAAGDAPAA